MTNTPQIPPFHLAIPVADLAKSRQFYAEVLGCKEGRSDEHWVDFNFFGHQLVIHQKTVTEISHKPIANPVDGHAVPIPHFGVVLSWNDWEKLAEDLKTKNIEFIIEPYIRFQGKVGEQATMFFLDVEGNALEFKAFKNMTQLFAK
ncbi:VOC family protein [uncultured Microscilla sp.]|uniref:VOC family protein n=1 Tax=uncultured Microscilla sp. TaxID=432653 RepID=UPI00262BD587|nr:VOC family protein [uncultured Microscilla sp.]